MTVDGRVVGWRTSGSDRLRWGGGKLSTRRLPGFQVDIGLVFFPLENTLSLSAQPVFLSRAIANVFDFHRSLCECNIVSKPMEFGQLHMCTHIIQYHSHLVGRAACSTLRRD